MNVELEIIEVTYTDKNTDKTAVTVTQYPLSQTFTIINIFIKSIRVLNINIKSIQLKGIFFFNLLR